MKNPGIPNHRLVSFSEARAQLGGVGRTTIYELIRKGHLKKVNLGRRGLISERSIQEYIEKLMAGSDAPPGDGETAVSRGTSGAAR
ncbi:helix-turn-helix domain-containing protein [Mycolicibacterium thermoresistibile]